MCLLWSFTCIDTMHMSWHNTYQPLLVPAVDWYLESWSSCSDFYNCLVMCFYWSVVTRKLSSVSIAMLNHRLEISLFILSTSSLSSICYKNPIVNNKNMNYTVAWTLVLLDIGRTHGSVRNFHLIFTDFLYGSIDKVQYDHVNFLAIYLIWNRNKRMQQERVQHISLLT